MAEIMRQRNQRRWRIGTTPVDQGFYLGAWKRGKKWIVSELWYNPSSIGTGWWASRGYLGQMTGLNEPIDVVAWMPLPEYKP